MPWNVHEAEVVLGKLFNLSASAVQRQLSMNLRHTSGVYDRDAWGEDGGEHRSGLAGVARAQPLHISMPNKESP